MELVFAFLAGLLTLVNPCVLPVLPIVVASSLQTDARAPLALAAGIGLSFVAVGTGIAAIGPAIGIYPEDVRRIAAVAMVGFGLVLVLPALGRRFSMASAGIAAVADARIAATPRRPCCVAPRLAAAVGPCRKDDARTGRRTTEALIRQLAALPAPVRFRPAAAAGGMLALTAVGFGIFRRFRSAIRSWGGLGQPAGAGQDHSVGAVVDLCPVACPALCAT